MDESRFAGSTQKIRLTGVSSNLVVARVRFHSELRHQTDERPDLSQSRIFSVFDFAGDLTALVWNQPQSTGYGLISPNRALVTQITIEVSPGNSEVQIL
jgi:hypothetical protein